MTTAPLKFTISLKRISGLRPDVLIDQTRKPIAFHVIINPKIIEKKGRMNYFFEGCLSLKNRVSVTPRHHSVTVECLDEHGEPKIITAEGCYARILQHEIGHLNGELYVDLSDARTEMEVNDAFKEKWLNALSPEIMNYLREKCPEVEVRSEEDAHRVKIKS